MAAPTFLTALLLAILSFLQLSSVASSSSAIVDASESEDDEFFTSNLRRGLAFNSSGKCEEACTAQGSCRRSNQIEICHNGRTECIGANGWNGHCHHSPNGTRDTCGACANEVPPQSPNCFSGSNLVQVKGRGSVAMFELNVGDWILTAPGGIYEPVYAFGHLEQNTSAPFLEISTNLTGLLKPLEISSEHLISVWGQRAPVPASTLKEGDVLEAILEENASQPEAASITKIRVQERTGLYAPLTPSGKLVVQGVAASSYITLEQGAKTAYFQLLGDEIDVSQEEFVHLYLTPYRLFCLGVAPKLCQPPYSNANGMPLYINWGIRLVQGIFGGKSPLQPLAEFVFLVLTVPLLVLCYGVESAFGGSFGLLIVVSICVFFVWIANKERKTKAAGLKKLFNSSWSQE